MQSHEDQIRQKYDGVTGLEITTVSRAEDLPQNERFVIGVYLLSEDGVPKGAQSMAGVPLKFIVTGRISPYPASGGR